MKPKPKPELKSNIPRQSFKLTKSDNELIKQLMEKYSLPNKTLAIQFALCIAVASYKFKK